jgi:hypothetical protein
MTLGTVESIGGFTDLSPRLIAAVLHGLERVVSGVVYLKGDSSPHYYTADLHGVEAPGIYLDGPLRSAGDDAVGRPTVAEVVFFGFDGGET